MPEHIDQSKNIIEIPYMTIKKICSGLDQKGKWREVIAKVKQKRFLLRQDEIEKLAQAYHRIPSANPSPSHDMWQLFGDRGMKVRHFVKYLDELRLEKELLLLKDPEPLYIVRQPSKCVQIERKETLKLLCEASGFPYPKYTWFAKYKNFPECVEVVENQTGVLEIKKIRRRHAGEYQCRVHNSLTMKAMKTGDCSSLLHFSEWSVVEVIADDSIVSDDEEDDIESIIDPPGTGFTENVSEYRPRITKQPGPLEIEVKEFGTICLECAAEGKPTPTYQWIRDDTVLQGQTKAKLVIKTCYLTNSGWYWCCINNGQEVQTRKVKIKVLDQQEIPGNKVLVIKQHPGNQTVEENTQVALFCEATGKGGTIHYAWYHVSNDKEVKLVKNEGINKHISGEKELDKIIIIQVTPETAGTYYCEVTLLDRVTRSLLAKERSCDAQVKLCDRPSRFVKNPKDKVALFIGIENYRNGVVLHSVPYDIKAAADRFQRMGFKVITLLDLTLAEITCAVDLICDFVDRDVYVTIYFVGHGFFYKGNHYLMPWDIASGPSLEHCVCLEKVFAKVQYKIPAFFLMIVDMCRTRGDDKLDGPKDVEQYDTKNTGNSIIIYAASQNEGSFEPGLENCVDEKRGYFSRNFCSVLDEYANTKTVKQLFNSLLDLFKLYLRNEGQKHPMHPEMRDNLLEHQIKLTDPISYNGLEFEAEKRNRKFNFINTIMDGREISFSVAGVQGLILSIEFLPRFSNQFVLVVYVKQLGCLQNIDIDLTITKLLTVNRCFSRNKKEFHFSISNIQRLEHDLNPLLILLYADTYGKQVKQTINLVASIEKLSWLNRPLISIHDIWKKSRPNINNTLLKQAEENEESCSSLEWDVHK